MHNVGRGSVLIASLSALVLVSSGCSRPGEAEPAPSLSSPAAEAGPTPDVTEPPYETELDLTADEKEAADEAYEVLVKFIQANNAVMADSGKEPERALQYLSGQMRDDHAEDYGSMAEHGEVGIGEVTHSYHHLKKLVNGDSDAGEAVFESCVDFSHFDMHDRKGESLAGADTGPTLTVYTLERVASGWKNVSIDFPGDSCG